MRPCRSTSVISTTRRPAPELASMPRWVTCQSEATPSLALYWHIGETTMRFASSRSASLIGEKRAVMRAVGMLLWLGSRTDHRDRGERLPSTARATRPTGTTQGARKEKNPPGGVNRAGHFDRRRGIGGRERRSGAVKPGRALWPCTRWSRLPPQRFKGRSRFFSSCCDCSGILLPAHFDRLRRSIDRRNRQNRPVCIYQAGAKLGVDATRSEVARRRHERSTNLVMGDGGVAFDHERNGSAHLRGRKRGAGGLLISSIEPGQPKL